MSVLEYFSVNGEEGEREGNKKKWDEKMKMAEEFFKKNNKMERTPPGIKRRQR